MNSFERAHLIAIAVAAFIAGAVLLGALIVGVPGGEEGFTRPPPASNQEPSFANEPVQSPIAPCAPAPAPGQATAPLAVANLTELARLDAGAGPRLIYHPTLRELLVPARRGGETAQAVTIFGDSAGTVRLPAPGATLAGVLPTDGENLMVGFAAGTPHLSVMSDWSVAGGEPAEPINIDLRGLELANVTSMAVHGDEGLVYLLDKGRGILRLQLPAGLAEAAGTAAVDACEIPEPAATRFVAVAVRQQDGHVFVLTRDGEADVLQYDSAGRYVAGYELGRDLPARPRSLAFGPSRSLDDAEGNEHLYLLTAERGGRRSVVAVALDAVASPAERRTVKPTLVRSTQTGTWTPPSADPTGIGWDSAREVLVVTDSEADELATFQDANVWSIGPRGDLMNTALSRTDEPTGVAISDDGALYFVTDDSDQVVQVINPGTDAQLGTRDDRVSYISTAAFGNQDPEGIAYGQRSLFIADGAGRRVYRVAAGANGVFDGVAPDGDDEVFSFNAAPLGLTDPEGIAYDPVRGTLYILDREQGAPIRETTTGGRLVRTILVGGLGLRSPAGLAIGPSSDDAALRSLYIVDRGVDNAVNAAEDDGLLVEIRLPAG